MYPFGGTHGKKYDWKKKKEKVWTLANTLEDTTNTSKRL